MKILQVIPYFYPAWSFGGPVRAAYHISRGLAARGHEVTVFTTNALNPRDSFKASGREYLVDGMLIRYFRNVAHFDGLYFSTGMTEALKKVVQDSDIIHMHEYRTFQNVVTYYIARQFRKPYVMTAHGSVPRVFERFLVKQLFDQAIGHRILRDAAALCAISKIEMKQYIDIGILKEKVALVPNGIDSEFFEQLPEPGMFKRKFKLNNDATIVLYVGRIHRRKGVQFLLDAFAQLGSANVVLVIVGPDDGYMAAVKERASRLKIADKVIFTGFVSERVKMAAYVDSAVVVYPGVYEFFGLVPFEAALCSKPVIVSDDSAMAEIIKQGGFGSSTKYGNTAQLMEVLHKILSDPVTAKEMGKKGRQFVKENYNWSSIVSKLEVVYSSSIEAN